MMMTPSTPSIPKGEDMCKMHIGIEMVGSMVHWTSKYTRCPRATRGRVNVLQPHTVEKPGHEQHAPIGSSNVGGAREWND